METLSLPFSQSSLNTELAGIFWGLVAGKTQTYLDWSSKPGDPPPEIWQHDLLHPDGSPLDPSEVETLKHWADWAKEQRNR